MKRIKFYLGTGFAGCFHEGVFEYEDNVSEEEINEDFEMWKNDRLDSYWWELED